MKLVPRLAEQGYRNDLVAERRAWMTAQTGSPLQHVGTFSLDMEACRGNIENPIGVAQIPLGVAGPLRVLGEHIEGDVYVPLATTEGALVRSYERGMVTLTRSGGATVRLERDENRVCPLFMFDDVAAAADFARRLPAHLEEVRAVAQTTTSHGRLLRLDVQQVGREVIVTFAYFTGDAQGMNMIVKATEAACQWIVGQGLATRFYTFSGYNSEKRASGSLMAGGKGKKVVAGATIPRRLAKAYLHATPEALHHLWQRTVIGHLQTAALGYNGHFANGLTALFIACGQDVANVANSAVGITHFEVTTGGDLYASVTLPSLSVATVGGGTGLGSSHECLQMMGCAGTGGALRLAEITAATLLAGELSFGAALASHEFVEAHETYGRNRPAEETP
jgi:hydroxymethylglutaryl-CoA reductase (NADPH)